LSGVPPGLSAVPQAGYVSSAIIAYRWSRVRM
jgi:hypothetical protein